MAGRPDTGAPGAVEAPLPVAAGHVLDADLGARLEIAPLDFLGRRGLLFGAAGQEMADGLVVHRADEAAAIETGLGGIAATTVRDTEEADRGDDQVGRAVDDVLAHVLQVADDAFFGKHPVHLVRSVVGRRCVGGGSQEDRGK